jgi:hypothetical protein
MKVDRQMIRAIGLIFIFLVILTGCSVKHVQIDLSADEALSLGTPDDRVQDKILSLQEALQSLSSEVSEEEAQSFSRAAVLYPYYLADRYDLVSPPKFHNFLITVGLKERGLCYHWTGDLIAYLQKQNFKSFDLYRAVVEQGNLGEHNAVVVTAKGQPFSEGIVLDAWRDSSDLFFTKVEEDREYFWVQNLKYKVIRG